jgi:phosphate transport system protein
VDEIVEGHTVKAYDGALSELRRRAHRMGMLVSQQVETAVRALLESDREAAELVLQREQQINAWQSESRRRASGCWRARHRWPATCARCSRSRAP